jgi:phage terminase large subunit
VLKGIATYVSTEKEFRFPNGSRIKLGYCDSETMFCSFRGRLMRLSGWRGDALHGKAVSCTYREQPHFRKYGGKNFKPRMYFTCNPGGVGHDWSKAFYRRNYRANEKPEDYCFIKSLVFDNHF